MLDRELQAKNNTLLYALIMYWFVDLMRVQNILPLEALKPGYFVTGILLLILAKQFNNVEVNSSIVLMLWFSSLLWLHVPFARNNRYAFNASFAFSVTVCACMCVNAYITSVSSVIKIYSVLFCIAVFLSIYALLHSGKGPGGYMTDENDIALFINMILPLGIYLYNVKIGRVKWLCLAGVVVLLAAEFATRSRGGFVGLAAMSLILVLRSKRKLGLLILLSTVFLVTATLINTYSDTGMSTKANYFDAVHSIGNTEDSTAQQRLHSWAAAYEMFKDNPLGVGGNNFQFRFPEYQTDFFKKEMWGRVAHSVWFTCLSELGFPGMFVLFVLLKNNFKSCMKIGSSPGDFSGTIDPLLYSMIGFIGSGTFISALYYPFLWNIIAIVSGIEKCLNKKVSVVKAVEIESML